MSAEDYARSALRTLAEVEAVESVATRHADIARQQLETLTSQVSALITINESVLSVIDAIAALKSAQATQASASAPVQANVSVSMEFNAGGYLLKNPDVAAAVARGEFGSPRDHWNQYGQYEGRAFAAGGMHSGGIRLVGENGPELEVTGPARIWNAEDTRAMLSGGGDGTASEVRALREDLRAIGRALAKNTADTAKLMQRWDGDGMPEVRVA